MKFLRQNIVVATIILLVVSFSAIFWLYRFGLSMFLLVLLIGVYIYIFHLILPAKIFSTNNLKTALVVFFLLAAMLAYFSDRYSSWDGRYFHIRVVNSVKEKGFFNPEYENVKPYLVEYLLGGVARFVGDNGISIIFALAVLATLILCIKLYSYLNLSLSVSTFLLIVLVLSPTYMAVAFYDFKTDIFLLTVSLCLYILFCIFVATQKPLHYLLLGLLCGFSLFIKISALPLVGTLFLIATYIQLKKLDSKKYYLVCLSLLFFMVPYLSWMLVNGVNIPMIQRPIGNYRADIFNTSASVANSCFAEVKELDYDSFIYGNNFPLLLAQPFFYLSGYKMQDNGRHTIATLGPILYLSVLLACFWPSFKKVTKSPLEKYLYIVMLVDIVAFYIFVGSVFWYLLPILPLTLYFSYRIFEAYFEGRLKNGLSYFILASSVVLFLTTIPVILGNDSTRVKSEDQKLSRFLEYETGDGPILTSSFLQLGVLYPYFVNSDQRIVRDNFLFASNYDGQRLYGQMQELNMQYIVVNNIALSDADEFFSDSPCVNAYLANMNKFLKEYAEPVFANDLDDLSAVVFRVK